MSDKAPRKLCRHCGKEPANRPRGLGWSCYSTPGVRELYPSGNLNLARRDETMEELDRMEAEQRRNLPSWWAEARSETD